MRLGRMLWRGGTALLTSTLVATLLVAGASSPIQTPATSAASGSTYLCTGYAGCRNAGYSDAGYGAVNSRMYWRMYSGHNCTNYAAYRMIKAGMSTERPWDGSGMAYNWGHAMARITDHRPSVGAIAWWDRYSGGIGSSGHVAYVERVVSADEIVISEDSWSGDFHWRRITRDSGRWPSGFIHFVDKAISNVEAPVITGTPQVGVRLTATRGTWSPGKGTVISRQWFADGTPIAGATGRTFTPTATEKGLRISVTTRATHDGYAAATTTTGPTEPVARGEFTVLTKPTITGDPVVGQVLTAVPATWSPPSEDTLYRWLADGVLIEGVSGPKLTVTRDLLGKNIAVGTHGRAPGYKNSPVRSAPVGPVVLGPIVASTPSTVTGWRRVGHQLTAVPGTVVPDDATTTYQWLRDGTPVTGSTAATYDLTLADLGAVMSVQVTRTRQDYADLIETITSERAVTVKPTMTVNAVGKSRRAVVRVHVTVPGLVVPGQVTVKVGRQVATGTLVDGRARIVVRGVAPGDRLVRAWYTGSGAILRAKGSTPVHVIR